MEGINTDVKFEALTAVKMTMLFFTSALKMETGWFSKTLVPTYKSTRRHHPEQQRHE
jgi:hypothetical protein